MWDYSFLGALTPKFYVALTGTSSLISGLILIFEWWYFRKYGTSFIEQVSLAHLGPWLGAGTAGGAGAAGGAQAEAAGAAGGTGAASAGGGGCAVWRNSMSLLRGAEYARLWTRARRAPLTYYDMNLTAQEHQAWFGCVGEGAAEEALGRAWREREPSARVAAAREALRHAPDCAAALLLLAEEDAPTVLEAERVLRRAWRAAEASLRGGVGGAARARDAAVLAHVKRRAAMCQRRLGRLRDAARLYRELARDAPPAPLPPVAAPPPLEDLLEVLLEQRAFPEAAAALARLEAAAAAGGPRSAAALYTRALLAARAGDACGADRALRAALAHNPHVPPLLLELTPLALPPEHVVRGAASEARAYAFFHLRHWRACPPALRALEAAWRARGAAALGRACDAGACADRELVAGGAGGAGGPRSAAALLPLAAALCAGAALTALCAHRWPARAQALLARVAPSLASVTPHEHADQ